MSFALQMARPFCEIVERKGFATYLPLYIVRGTRFPSNPSRTASTAQIA
jgi:hypothetical protein